MIAMVDWRLASVVTSMFAEICVLVAGSSRMTDVLLTVVTSSAPLNGMKIGAEVEKPLSESKAAMAALVPGSAFLPLAPVSSEFGSGMSAALPLSGSNFAMTDGVGIGVGVTTVVVDRPVPVAQPLECALDGAPLARGQVGQRQARRGGGRGHEEDRVAAERGEEVRHLGVAGLVGDVVGHHPEHPLDVHVRRLEPPQEGGDVGAVAAGAVVGDAAGAGGVGDQRLGRQEAGLGQAGSTPPDGARPSAAGQAAFRMRLDFKQAAQTFIRTTRPSTFARTL